MNRMKSKSLFFVLAIMAVFALTVCTPTASAQPNMQLWGQPACIPDASNLYNNAETFALGNIRSDGATIDEGNDYLEFSTAVFPALCVLDESYTTLFAHSVQAIGFQMGSGTDVAEEWAFWVDITLPVPFARTIRLPKQQYDKHWANGPGNRNDIMSIDITLPVGTVIRIRRPAVVCIGVPASGVVNPAYPANYGPYNGNNCITGQAITFVGK